jgi:glutamine amidotransferase
MICIVDYGVGNIQAFLNLFKRLGIEARRVENTAGLSEVDRLVLPGVGNFDDAMNRLNKSGLRPRLEELVLNAKVPVLGVCVGMQMMAHGSDEGNLEGLGWIPGRVRSFSSQLKNSELPMPHMGWNELHPLAHSMLFSKGFENAPQFYFLHSYFFDAENKEDVAAKAHYGLDFDAVVSRGHIHGVQCHPEKSHKWGEQLLRNFVEL